MEYPKLKVELDNRYLIEEEKKMWLRIGMYVTTEPTTSSATGRSVLKLFDAVGNETEIGVTVGRNMRMSVLSWWQVEKVKSRASEPVDNDNTGLSSLETRNG